MRKYLNAWREMVGIWQNFIATPKFKNAFLWGIVLYAIALFALIRGDIYYYDDWGSSSRDTSWNHFSRYLTTLILNDITTFSKGSIDLSPLPQILSVILAVASSLILIYLIRKRFDLIGIMASLPLGLSPHFLENLSYKFESLTMGFALFFAVLPFLFKGNRRIFSVVSVISLLCMFMTYQAANGTYIVLSLYFAFSAYFFEKRKFKESVIFLAICAMNLIVATLIYRFIIVEPVSEYVIAYASDKMFPMDSLLLGVWANLSIYLITIFNDFKQTPYIWLVALISMLFVINVAIRTNRPKIIAICGAILFLVFGICLSYGLYLVLQKPLFLPRVFYGFNAFVAILCIANITLLNRVDSNAIHKTLHCASATITIITAYFLISFANIYGNALKKQDEYITFRAGLLLQDLLKSNIHKNAVIVIKGSLGYSAVTGRFVNKYGDISRLVWEYKNVNWVMWLLAYFNAPYSMYYKTDEICEWLQEKFGSEVIFKNTYHIIEKTKHCYFVTIKE